MSIPLFVPLYEPHRATPNAIESKLFVTRTHKCTQPRNIIAQRLNSESSMKWHDDYYYYFCVFLFIEFCFYSFFSLCVFQVLHSSSSPHQHQHRHISSRCIHSFCAMCAYCVKHIIIKINNFQVFDRLAQVGSFNFCRNTKRRPSLILRLIVLNWFLKWPKKKLSITYWFALESGPKNENNKPCFGADEWPRAE